MMSIRAGRFARSAANAAISVGKSFCASSLPAPTMTGSCSLGSRRQPGVGAGAPRLLPQRRGDHRVADHADALTRITGDACRVGGDAFGDRDDALDLRIGPADGGIAQPASNWMPFREGTGQVGPQPQQDRGRCAGQLPCPHRGAPGAVLDRQQHRRPVPAQVPGERNDRAGAVPAAEIDPPHRLGQLAQVWAVGARGQQVDLAAERREGPQQVDQHPLHAAGA
jgi:hypothetical protein